METRKDDAVTVTPTYLLAAGESSRRSSKLDVGYSPVPLCSTGEFTAVAVAPGEEGSTPNECFGETGVVPPLGWPGPDPPAGRCGSWRCLPLSLLVPSPSLIRWCRALPAFSFGTYLRRPVIPLNKSSKLTLARRALCFSSGIPAYQARRMAEVSCAAGALNHRNAQTPLISRISTNCCSPRCVPKASRVHSYHLLLSSPLFHAHTWSPGTLCIVLCTALLSTLPVDRVSRSRARCSATARVVTNMNASLTLAPVFALTSTKGMPISSAAS